MLGHIKLKSVEYNLFLNQETISCDFEKTAIKAFKFHFPSAKIIGCHFYFHFHLGLKSLYFGEDCDGEFKLWVRM